MLETFNIAERSFNTGMNVRLIEPQRCAVLLGEDRINNLAIIFRRRCKIYEKHLLASSCLSVFFSVGLEQLSSHWTDFNETDI
jgi:hypothetical protein